MKIELDYQNYLDEWENHFQDETEGEFRYLRFGKERVRTYQRMSKAEFAQCVIRFNELFNQLDELTRDGHFGKEYDTLDIQCFYECELPLFC